MLTIYPTSQFNKDLSDIIDKHAPIKSRKTSRKPAPWMNSIVTQANNNVVPLSACDEKKT